ncbi:MAG: FMN-binding protein [Fusobacteriaceae bacterium]
MEKIRKYGILLFILAGFIMFGYEKTKVYPTFEGVADGFYDDIKVIISAKTNKKGELRISNIEIDSKDTPEIAGPAIEKLKAEIMKKQSLKIDIVSGATYTSEGVIEALRLAMEKVKEAEAK